MLNAETGFVHPQCAPRTLTDVERQLAWTGNAEVGRCVAFAPAAARREGYAVWEPHTNRVVAVEGDAWRYLAWMVPRVGSLPERVPYELLE